MDHGRVGSDQKKKNEKKNDHKKRKKKEKNSSEQSFITDEHHHVRLKQKIFHQLVLMQMHRHLHQSYVPF